MKSMADKLKERGRDIDQDESPDESYDESYDENSDENLDESINENSDEFTEERPKQARNKVASQAEDDFSDLEEGQLSPIVAKNLKKPMSVYGIGPIFGLIAVILTVAGILLRKKWVFDSGVPENKVLRYIYLGLGIAIILAGVIIYFQAVFGARIDDYIRRGKLCTEGVYAWVRNPIYTALLFACTGALFISGNVYMYAIPIILWILLTILLKKTEEPDLFKRFGQEYADYYATVNRVLPKPPAR